MRVCNCTGYLTNPGGRCCMDGPAGGTPPYPSYPGYPNPWGPPPTTDPSANPPCPPPMQNPIPVLTEEQIRRILREELDRREKP